MPPFFEYGKEYQYIVGIAKRDSQRMLATTWYPTPEVEARMHNRFSDATFSSSDICSNKDSRFNALPHVQVLQANEIYYIIDYHSRQVFRSKNRVRLSCALS